MPSFERVLDMSISRYNQAELDRCIRGDTLFKSRLREYAQRRGLPGPVYQSTKSGQDHSPEFMSTVEIDHKMFTGGPMRRKKDAEADAARNALRAIETQSTQAASGETDGQEQQGFKNSLACTSDSKKRARDPSDTSEEGPRGQNAPLQPGTTYYILKPSEVEAIVSLKYEQKGKEGRGGELQTKGSTMEEPRPPQNDNLVKPHQETIDSDAAAQMPAGVTGRICEVTCTAPLQD